MVGDSREVTFRRHAEVIVRDALPLRPHLRWIYARSLAELQTLIAFSHERSPEALTDYRSSMLINAKAGLFLKQWAFVETASLSGDRLIVTFNPPKNDRDAGPFELRMEAKSLADGRIYVWQLSELMANRPLRAILPERGMTDVQLTITLDGCIAYRHRFSEFRRMVG